MKFLKMYNLKNYKWLLILTVVTLSILGVLVVGSAKESVQDRQIVGLILGIILMVIISFIDYEWILKLSWILYFVNLILLLAVEFFGYEANNAQRWIDLKFTTLQPSELTKIIFVIFFAKYFMEHKEEINNWKFLLKSCILFAIPTYLILRQPDLSTTLSMIIVFVVLIFLTGFSYKVIGIVAAIAIPLMLITFWYVVQPDQVLLADYQQNRILSWLDPDSYADDGAYQQNNSKIAIGSGQLYGKGLNNNTTTSVKNGNFISEPQTDFIFAIIGEELGFVGCCCVITLLLLIVIQCILVGVKCQLFAGQLICYGIAAQIGFQGFINIGVATGLLPNTGIPLPFVSYGLTSLVSLYIAIGIILNIGLHQKKY